MDEENKKRINIEDLARPEEELTDDEATNVQGGTFYGTGVYKSTDSGKTAITIGGGVAPDPSRKMGDGSV